jgi:hypothetical protein
MTTIVFRVSYPYYQYNTGSANNGYFTGHVDHTTLEKAHNVADLIRVSAEETNAGVEQSSNILEQLGLDGEGHMLRKPVTIEKITTITEKIR